MEPAVTQLLGPLVSLLVGGRCPGCGLASGAIPCAACRAELEAGAAAPGSVWHDGGVIGRLVRAGKHGHWRGAGRQLAGAACARGVLARACASGLDLVAWVPADARRRAQRGGHLPERFGRRVAQELGIPSVPLLERRHSRSQRGLGRVDRARNAAAAFAARPQAHARGRVLLVDDVRTTGATLMAAAAVVGTIPGVTEVVRLAIVGVDNPRPFPPGEVEHL